MKRDRLLISYAEELGLGDLSQILMYELDADIQGLQLYDDVLPALRLARSGGFKVGVSSNLAPEFGHSVMHLLPGLNSYTFSFEAGAIKPSALIYKAACSSLRCKPRNALFVGDSMRADYDGPTAFGMHAHLLDRSKENLQFSLDNAC